MLLTGDNAAAAARVAADVGIDEVRAGLLPQDKVAAVSRTASAGAQVLLVGDGVNDAPAMAAADIGLAMGGAARTWPCRPPTVSSSVTNWHRSRGHRAVPPGPPGGGREPDHRLGHHRRAGRWDLLGHLPLPLGVAGHEGAR